MRTALRRRGGLEAEQGPGELLFVPPGWWQTAVNLEPTVAYTENFATAANAEAVAAKLERLGDTFIPDLYARIEAAQSSDPAELERMGAPSESQLVEAMTVLQSRSEGEYVRARDQLQTLLDGERLLKAEGREASEEGAERRAKARAGSTRTAATSTPSATRCSRSSRP